MISGRLVVGGAGRDWQTTEGLSMKVAAAFDHRGVSLREAILEALAREQVIDLGTDTAAVRIDYPDKARQVRAAICHDLYSAHQAVEHDDLNVLCLGSEIIGAAVARELVAVFLAARFDGGARYVARLEKVAAMERGMHV
jgi:ribose 5-phosphate isomerase B